MIEVVIDMRESRSPVWAALHNNPEVTCVVRELACGDYLPSPTFGIERKEATDFVASIMDKRLFTQVLRLKDEFESVTFIIEGDVYSTRSLISPDAIRGALSYLMTIEKVSVVMVKNAQETAALIHTMARHLQEGLGYDISLRTQKPKNLTDLANFLVEGLPGVGATTAKALCRHFGTAAAVMAATEAELLAAPGIGKKTAQRIREALEHRC